MKNKDRCLRAREELVKKYRNPVGETFFASMVCPLCKIFVNRNWSCAGCPLASENSSPGCVKFESYKKAWIFIKEKVIINNTNYTPEVKAAFNARAKFFERIKPILEAMPPEQFTKKGWRYTGDIISRKW